MGLSFYVFLFKDIPRQSAFLYDVSSKAWSTDWIDPISVSWYPSKEHVYILFFYY